MATINCICTNYLKWMDGVSQKIIKSDSPKICTCLCVKVYCNSALFMCTYVFVISTVGHRRALPPRIREAFSERTKMNQN